MQKGTIMTDTLIGLLEPISERDWDGKWRIQKALRILQHDAAAEDKRDIAAYDEAKRKLASGEDEIAGPLNLPETLNREAFEKWASKKEGADFTRHEDGGYERHDVHVAWEAWKAASSHDRGEIPSSTLIENIRNKAWMSFWEPWHSGGGLKHDLKETFYAGWKAATMSGVEVVADKAQAHSPIPPTSDAKIQCPECGYAGVNEDWELTVNENGL
jgi:hypothetical protein